jgi:hypothetical protein
MAGAASPDKRSLTAFPSRLPERRERLPDSNRWKGLVSPFQGE